MSLIERAMEKSRAATRAAVRSDATTEMVAPIGESAAPAAPVLASREVVSPALAVSDDLLRRAGLRAPEGTAHQQASEYRHIKRQVVSAMQGQQSANARVVMITSALAGEGKSYSAANLALSMALEPDYTTLLIDADVVKPNISRQFGIADRRGLMDAAADPGLDVESLVVTTDIPGLSLLPAGHAHSNATEHFGSARMQEVFRRLLAPRNRLIVLDSLPLLLTTEARALVQHAGQVLFVVRAEATPKSAVLQALELLGEGCDVKMILNAVKRDHLSRYYGYEYNYNYASSR